MNWPSSYVISRTIGVSIVAATISISISTGVRIIYGVEADWITVLVRWTLPFIIALPLGSIWFTRVEKLESDYRELLSQTNDLARRAATDPLTGLLNRRSFAEQFNLAMSHSVIGTFVIADVDYLKTINDEHGHLAGDDAIVSIAMALSEVLGKDNLIARIGGDEFCAFIPRRDKADVDRLLAEVNRRATEDFRKRSGLENLALSISFGALQCKPNTTFREMMARTDSTLYRKKKSRSAEVA